MASQPVFSFAAANAGAAGLGLFDRLGIKLSRIWFQVRRKIKSTNARQVAWCAVGGLIGISALMNFRFGLTLGSTTFDALIYGMMSACADILKCSLPLVVVAAFRRWNPAKGLLASGLFLLVFCFSLYAALGYAAYNWTAQHATKLDAPESSELADMNDRLLAFGDLQPAAFYAKRAMDARSALGDKLFEASSACTLPGTSAQTMLCRLYDRTRADLENARQAESLEVEIAKLKSQLASRVDDPRAKVLEGVLGVDAGKASKFIILLVFLLVELGSAFGPFCLMRPIQRRKGFMADMRRRATAKIEELKRADAMPRPNTGRVRKTPPPSNNSNVMDGQDHRNVVPILRDTVVNE